ncbi:MAG: hypothetical protein PVJ89_03965 [Planctomycetota bacterium]|jgi:hypothetical protein
MFKKTSTTFVAALCVAGVASAQATNDTCATAAAAPLGSTAFDTTTAIDEGTIPFNCAAGGGADVWFSYTAATTDDIIFDLCGSSYDTALTLYSGSCSALNEIACNDDSCGLQSSITATSVAVGNVYLVRIAGFNGGTGFGTLNIAEQAPPPGTGNDTCATATALTLNTPVATDTTTAVDEGLFWNCAGTGAADIWYSITSSSTNDLVIELCGSSYDTALEVYDGTCSALNLIECNDDSCGLQSSITVGGVAAGTTYYVRVGGWNGSTGFGTINVSEQVPPPPPAPNCAETTYANNNGGAAGGAVYFDITVSQAISIAGLEVNTGAAQTAVTMYTTPGTYLGNENNPAAWTPVAEDDGLGIGNGSGTPSSVNFVTPASLAPGTYGIALVGDNFTTGVVMDHDYTNGTGANQNYVSLDGVITLDLGAATNAPFTGTVFTPRVWNGKICSSGPVAPGTNYCAANNNSTGSPASMSASGSNSVSANDLVLEANDLPINSFGFFLTSQTQGFVANPGGSEGNLCLGGAIGRYVGPGQIQNSGATGMISLAIDNTQVPQPTGFAAVAAGDTWNFQLWHRDSSGGSPTSNFTDGYEITFN